MRIGVVLNEVDFTLILNRGQFLPRDAMHPRY